MPADVLGRPLRELRLSVTDRCNFRCQYCMPAGPVQFMPRTELLTFGEIERVARILARVGVHKIRLTGGEPLLRRDLAALIGSLVAIDGIGDLGLTTNGWLLAELAPALRAAGLRRVTVSLDALDDALFRTICGVNLPVGRVLDGIDAALALGFAPVKLNAVIKRGLNESSIVPLAGYARERGLALRLIEYMDVGGSNGWRREDVVDAAEMLAIVDVAYPLDPIGTRLPGRTAELFRYRDGGGELGIVAPISRPFCTDCARARLTADGRLFTCLYGVRSLDVRSPLRRGASDDEIAALVVSAWQERADRYGELRSARGAGAPRPEMWRIGG